jgi:hydroxymethylbilane synthase
MTRLIRLGTRDSRLALWQTEYVRARLEKDRADTRCQTVVITTTGDRLKDTALPAIGGKGLFTAELEMALGDGSIDLAVHSLKDLPTQVPSGLAVGAVLARVDPSDVLVSRMGFTLASLPVGARVGTSSTRRKAQLLAHRADLKVLDVRGNADTRLRKAHDERGPYDAIVVARAALERLGELWAVSDLLPEEIMLPAPGQGALAVECRNEGVSLDLVRGLNDFATDVETRAERSFLDALGGGCAVPVAARGRLEGGTRLRISGRVCAVDGSRQIDVVGDVVLPARGDARRLAEEAGRALAVEARSKGAGELLEKARSAGEGLGA